MTSPTGDGTIMLYSTATLASDALLTAAQDITGDTLKAMCSLTEPDGAGQLNAAAMPLNLVVSSVSELREDQPIEVRSNDISLLPNQAEVQVIYTVTGVFEGRSPLVASGESFTAVFEIDDSVVDTNSSTEKGFFPGAILSSSITFSGGYTSTVDFAGGTVIVRKSGRISFSAPRPAPGGPGPFTTKGSFLLSSLKPFDSDALLTAAQDVAGDNPQSLWFLSEPKGEQITSFTPLDLEVSSASSTIDKEAE